MLLSLGVAFLAGLIAKSDSWKRFTASIEGQVDYRKDYSVALLCAFLIPVARYVIDRTAFSYAAKLLVVPSTRAKLLKARSPAGRSGGKRDGDGLTQEDRDAIRVRVEKFKESCWKTAVYVFFSLYGFYFMSSKPWFYDRSHFWHGFQSNGPNCQWDHSCPSLCTTDEWPGCSTCKFTSDVKLYYVLELGYYLQGVVSLLFWETRRKDFAVMMSHHIVTIVLITFSHWARLLR